jgi:hypothetical protein
MNAVSVVITVIAGTVAVLVGIGRGLRAVWRISEHAHELAGAVKDNTSATHTLSEEFRIFRGDVTRQLTDHAERITRLENHP